MTVRTFQNKEHAEMFLLMCKKIVEEEKTANFKFNVKIIKNPR
tara:strand:+ start:693 stop:821 length:129 start_codon:yes stop_codon:yes gene_type:complete